MTFTPRQLNRATLHRQLLLQREHLDVEMAVRRVAVIQAQEPASPYVALWSRLANLDPSDVDAVFADGRVVKATLVRITLHAVHADDYPRFHRAMVANLRASRLNDRRFAASGMSIPEVDAMLPRFLSSLSEARTTKEIDAVLAELMGGPKENLWWALRTFAPLHHIPTGGAWSFGPRSAFRTPPSVLSADDEERSVQHLLVRYLEGFGPASAADFAQFAMLRQPAVRRAIDALADQLVTATGPDGKPLYDIAEGVVPDADVPAPPRLLPMWDSTLLAYSDRGRIIPPEYRSHVIRRNGDVLPTLLVDGYVAGVWRTTDDGIEATAFHPLTNAQWRALGEEAASLRAFVADRDPAVFRRYTHWWEKGLPAAEVRVLS